jgi:DNA-binding LacI/PurR family transcriptional regulator
MNRHVTMGDVAERAGVSRPTVSRALRGDPRLFRSTIERVQAAAAELGYRPNPWVSALMAQVRARRRPGPAAALAYVVVLGPGGSTPGDGAFAGGARERAGELGYRFEVFGLRPSPQRTRRLERALRSRSIRGIVLAPLPEPGPAPGLDWSRYAAAAIGFSASTPDFHRAVNDQFGTMLLALDRLRGLGRRRIGLALSGDADVRTRHAWSAAYAWFQRSLPRARCIPPLLPRRIAAANVLRWTRRYRPDAIMGVDWGMLAWLRSRGIETPRDIAYAQLDWHPRCGCAGVRQNGDAVGAAAVELVAAQLEQNERGVPARPRTVLVRGDWIDGPTAARAAPAGTGSAGPGGDTLGASAEVAARPATDATAG